MAQQVGALRFKGKVGNVVGFGNSASEKVNKNFVRQQASSVANPKTYKQAEQRSKVKPAAAFYSAFENVLNHAFLPSQRASKNRNMFMKKAMTLGAIPDVRKDDNYLPVVPYQISEGNLGLDYLTEMADRGSVNFNIVHNLDTDLARNTTIAALSSAILANTSGLEEGQEITILAIIAQTNNLYVRRAVHISFVLDSTNSLTTVGDILGDKGLEFNTGTNLGIYTTDNDKVILAAGCIISSKTASSWRYTKSFMTLTTNADNLPNIEGDVILSYMSAESTATSDKILQQANNSSVANVVIISTTTAAISNATGYSGTLAPATATVAVYNNGSRAVVTMIEDGEEVLAWKDGDTWKSVKRTNEGVTAGVPLASTNLAGNRTVDYSAVVARGL